MSSRDLAAGLGIPPATLSRYITGYSLIPLDMFARICLALGVSPAWLLLGRGPERIDAVDLSAVPDDQVAEEWLARQKRLFDQVRRAVAMVEPAPPASPKRSPGCEARPPKNGFVEVPSHDVPSSADWQDRYVPIIDAVAAGNDLGSIGAADDYPPGWAESFVEYADAPHGSFAVRVAGRSMEPAFRDGDLVIIDPSKRPIGGRPAVVVFEDAAVGRRKGRIKVLRRRGKKVILESLAPGHDPIELTTAEVLAAYPVYAHLPKVARQVDKTGHRE